MPILVCLEAGRVETAKMENLNLLAHVVSVSKSIATTGSGRVELLIGLAAVLKIHQLIHYHSGEW